MFFRMHPLCTDRSKWTIYFITTTEPLSAFVQFCPNVTGLFHKCPECGPSLFNCAKDVKRAYQAFSPFGHDKYISSFLPLCRKENNKTTKEQTRKDNCQAVFKHLKHVGNVSHRQKPYLDYSCKVVVFFFVT